MNTLWIYASEPYAGTYLSYISEALSAARVRCRLISEVPLAQLVATLATDHLQRPDALLGLADMDDPALDQLNRSCCRTKIPLLTVNTSGGSVQLGPGVVPGATGCLACYATYAQFFSFGDTQRGGPIPADSLPATITGWLVEQIGAFVRGAGPLRQGYIARWHPNAQTFQSFRPFKDPVCVICSISARYPTEIVQAFQYKTDADS